MGQFDLGQGLQHCKGKHKPGKHATFVFIYFLFIQCWLKVTHVYFLDLFPWLSLGAKAIDGWTKGVRINYGGGE